MTTRISRMVLVVLWAGLAWMPMGAGAADTDPERMDWWREARFGLFLHWGLYAIPAGEWNGETGYGEWIMHSAQIPVERYEQFVGEFNPVAFDADEWVRMAKDAGMKYIVITSKHHDGFCLFDSAHTDYDIMSTPFRRDILKELAEACRREGMRICWYHSIMDWHHPDYLPRRGWETRDDTGADFDRYVTHLKKQIKEIVTHYGDIGVLWFDGEWESTWTHDLGAELYDYVRSLQPSIIVNNRVDVGRAGMAGMSESDRYKGDFGTPEQQIPATGIPGVDWETCMTMNDHWGYNRHNDNWKSTEDLVRKLADIASKGGNFLLNVGPTAEGRFPQESIDRLAGMGRWMKSNGESIHGTQASPFSTLEWGRCTTRPGEGDAWFLYLHVFDWPEDGVLILPGLDNPARSARLLAAPNQALRIERTDHGLAIRLPAAAPDPINTVVQLEVSGRPVVIRPPTIEAAASQFVDSTPVILSTEVPNATIYYTVDGTAPDRSATAYQSPLALDRSTTVRARLFRDDRALGAEATASFARVTPRPAVAAEGLSPGLACAYYEGTWERVPAFDELEPVGQDTALTLGPDLLPRDEHAGLRFTGFLRVPVTGVYTLACDSDDGSRVLIGDTLVVDNDGLHSATQVSGLIALAAGFHPITVHYFNATGGKELTVGISGPGLDHESIPGDLLFHR